MRKIVISLVTFAIFASLCACGSKSASTATTSQQNNSGIAEAGPTTSRTESASTGNAESAANSDNISGPQSTQTEQPVEADSTGDGDELTYHFS